MKNNNLKEVGMNDKQLTELIISLTKHDCDTRRQTELLEELVKLARAMYCKIHEETSFDDDLKKITPENKTINHN